MTNDEFRMTNGFAEPGRSLGVLEALYTSIRHSSSVIRHFTK